jgi:hypothetical protein
MVLPRRWPRRRTARWYAALLEHTADGASREEGVLRFLTMPASIVVTLSGPDEVERLRLPEAVDKRLHDLLDRQDRGEELTNRERTEAEGLVDLAEFLSLLRLRAQSSAA